MKPLTNKIVQFRWPVIIGFVLISLFFGLQIPRTEIEPDMKEHLPRHISSRIDMDKIEYLFGGTEMLMILLKTDDVLNPETLMRVQNLSEALKRVKGIDKVLSVFDLKYIRSEEGAMIVDPAVRHIPETDAERETLRGEIKNNDMVFGSVVSEDFTITAVIGVLKNDVSDTELVPAIENLLFEISGEEETLVGGMAYTRYHIAQRIQKDMMRLMPIGLIVMIAFLFICFRQPGGVLLPFAAVILSILFSMGIIPLIGWKIQTVTIILPIFLVAVANDYGIHMMAKYQEDNIPGNTFSPVLLAERMIDRLGKPVLLAGITTMAGMLCLLGHIMIPARQLGILAAAGIAWALASSLLFIPAVISLLPKSRPVLSGKDEHAAKGHILERLLWEFGQIVIKKPKSILIIFILSGLAAAAGVLKVDVDTDPNSFFPDDHPLIKASKLIDSSLGGSQNVSVVFQGDIRNPEIMKKLDAAERRMAALPEVGLTTSAARIIRQMSRALHDSSESGYDQIPETREAIAQYFELYAMSGDAEDFEKLVDFPYEHAIVTARINTTRTSVLSKTARTIQGWYKNDANVLLTGGFGVMLADLARIMLNGQLVSLALAVLIVAVLIMILFRSVSAGLISAIPLAASVLILFGLMGLFGIELNIATTMLSSIMIGVGIDYTIHFLWRCREEKRNGLDIRAAVTRTMMTTGRGIVFNAFSVMIGFFALLFSGFKPVQFFGFLVIVSILACLVGALMLVPSLCILLKPRFLEFQESLK